MLVLIVLISGCVAEETITTTTTTTTSTTTTTIQVIEEEGPEEMRKDLFEEDFALTYGQTKYFYFIASGTGNYEIYINKQCSECNANYFNLEIMTSEQCSNKKNSLPYNTLYEIKHKWNIFAHFGHHTGTKICIAVTHDDSETKEVIKHILVRGEK